MPRIALNATVLTPKSGGILVYVKNLVDRLLSCNTSLEVQIFFSTCFLENFPSYKNSKQVTGLKLSGENPKTRILSDPFIWPGVIRKYQIDLFHSPISYLPLGVKVPSVVTIHDLRAFHFPENYSTWRGAFLRKMIRRTVKKAVRLIAVSDYTKNDLIQTLKVPAEKVVRIYEGFDPVRFQRKYSEAELLLIRQKYNLPARFILSVGHLEPRKNYIRLIQAYYQIIQQEKIPHQLVIVGQENYGYEKFYEIIQKLNLHKNVIFTGFVAHDDLPALYQLADCFVLPSLFEGFGFPPLESMAARTPVISSNVTSLPEICGEAALLFDPRDENDLAAKIVRVLTDETLKMKLVEKGSQNINRFSWERCTLETVKLYQEIS